MLAAIEDHRQFEAEQERLGREIRAQEEENEELEARKRAEEEKLGEGIRRMENEAYEEARLQALEEAHRHAAADERERFYQLAEKGA